MKAKKKRRIVAKGLFAFLSIMLVPLFTISFGFKKSPIEYTLSNIGNFFDYRVNFIIWGVVTGAVLVGYILLTYKFAEFDDPRSKKFLLWSDAFLVLTVVTPALRDSMKFWYWVHTLSAGLFALFLVTSLLLFLHYISLNNKRVYSKSLFLLLFSVGFPVSLLFVFDGLTGIAEISFFVLISVFLMLLNIYLHKDQKERQMEEEISEKEIEETVK